jgi:signal transduction histidine kinase
VNGAACYLVGNFAHLILTAERANLANQQLSIELQNANQKLHAAAAQRQELAVLQERGRMARELHDSVTQTIFSMNLSVQSARMLADKDMSLVTEQLDRLQELARSAVSEVQVLISQLRLASLDSGQLSQALGELVRQRQVQDGLQIDLQVIADRPLPQPAIQGLYRIVQEALNNIVKHAGTNQASIRVDLQAQPAYVEISDLGCGFDPDAAAGDNAHLGLAGMASRAAELGWKFHLDSQPGTGTLIRLEEIAT